MNPIHIIEAPMALPGFYAMSFALRLITLRRERGLTQQGFADATGIHVQQIKRYEAGTSQPSAEALKKIAKAFGVTTDWLLFEDAERGPDEDLRLQFEAMAQLTPEEKAVARAVLEGLILKHAARQWGGQGNPLAAK
jgi:transcriptional regulator with XRE-family HTH domain